jgi:hypothetical protein
VRNRRAGVDDGAFEVERPLMRATSLLLLLLAASPSARAGSLPNPLEVFGADNTPYTIHFSANGATFEGQNFVPFAPNRYRTGSLPQHCGLATSVATQVELDVTLQGVTVTHRELAVPCRGKHQPISIRVRRFGFTPLKAPNCIKGASTWERTRGQGVAAIDVDDPCDGSLKLTWAEGLAAWVSGETPKRAARETAPTRWSGIIGKSKLTVSSKAPKGDPSVRDVKAPKSVGLTGSFIARKAPPDASP